MDLKLAQRALIVVIGAVTLMWFISFLAPLTPWAPEGYRPYPELNIALLGVVALLGELLRRSRKPIDPPANDDDNKEDQNG